MIVGREADRLFGWYQREISPIVGVSCRFEPSCSHYTRLVVRSHGVGRGLLLGASRVLRCHAAGGAGLDTPPRYASWSDAVLALVRAAQARGPRTIFGTVPHLHPCRHRR